MPKQPSLPFWSILQGGMDGEGVEVEGTDLQWPQGVHKRTQMFNAYYVSVFDFSARVLLNLHPPCAQVSEYHTLRRLTEEEQVATAQSVTHQQLWWDLTESTSRMDLLELEEWMGEQGERSETT